MSRRLITLISTVFILLVIGMFAFTYLKKAEAPVSVPAPEPTQTTDAYNVTRIEAKHFFQGGVHTIVGEISMPTPCDLLKTTARVAESMPEQITYDFTVVNNSESCVQTVTAARFKVAANASLTATQAATFMGRPVELNLVEAAPGETPDDFELFIKG